MSKRKNGSPGPGASRSNNKKKRECLLHSLCAPNCSRRTRSRQEADPWGFCPISGYLFSSGGLSLLQLPFSLAALWIGSYGGRSWTFRCLPTAAPHLSAPSKLGAYSIVFITGPPFSIYIITHGRRKVKGFCEKILIFLGSVPSILCEVALLPDALRGIVPTIYIAGDGTPSD